MSEVALPSWNDTATRSSIVEFVESVDVPPEERDRRVRQRRHAVV